LQRGHRFLKRFRQRLAQSISTETTERISHEIKPTEHQRQSARHEGSKLKRLEPLRKWILEANEAQNTVISDDWLKMKSFLIKNGSNRLLRDQTLTVSFKKPFDLLAETVVAVRNLPDDPSRCSRWWRRRELNPRPKQANQPRLHAYSK
jgi:hypothetical protein